LLVGGIHPVRARNVEITSKVSIYPGVADYLKPLKLEAETAPNRLIVSGDSWLVRFDGGENLMVKHQKGFVYLAVLLEHPGKDISVLDLTKATVEKEGQSFLSGSSEVIDVQALREYRRQIEIIQNRIADGEYSSSTEKEELLQEQERIRNEVRNAVTATGHLRKRNSQLDKPRQAVYRAVHVLSGIMELYLFFAYSSLIWATRLLPMTSPSFTGTALPIKRPIFF